MDEDQKTKTVNELCDAITRGNTEKVKADLEQLMEKLGTVEMRRLLHTRGSSGYALLHLAINAVDAELVKFMLEMQASPNGKSGSSSPLQCAVQFANAEIVKLLLNAGADPLPERNELLLLASTLGKTDVIDLLKTGIKKAFFNELYMAASMRGTERLRRLLAEMATELSPDEIREIVNYKTIFDSTLLHDAAWLGMEEMAKLLIGHGADVNGRDIRGRTPLHFAARLRDSSAAKILVENGADVNAVDVDGFTPLYSACRGAYETISLLLAKGADPNVKIGKYSLLELAIMNRHGLVADILSRQIHLNEQLFEAVRNDDYERIQKLIELGAQTNAIDAEGNSALHAAVQTNASVTTVNSLLKHGADPNLPNGKRMSPYQLALSMGNIHHISIMQQNGAGTYKAISFLRLAKGLATEKSTQNGGGSSDKVIGLHNYRSVFYTGEFGRRGSQQHLRFEQRKLSSRLVA